MLHGCPQVHNQRSDPTMLSSVRYILACTGVSIALCEWISPSRNVWHTLVVMIRLWAVNGLSRYLHRALSRKKLVAKASTLRNRLPTKAPAHSPATCDFSVFCDFSAYVTRGLLSDLLAMAGGRASMMTSAVPQLAHPTASLGDSHANHVPGWSVHGVACCALMCPNRGLATCLLRNLQGRRLCELLGSAGRYVCHGSAARHKAGLGPSPTYLATGESIPTIIPKPHFIAHVTSQDSGTLDNCTPGRL
jgi:hypothetical protein